MPGSHRRTTAGLLAQPGSRLARDAGCHLCKKAAAAVAHQRQESSARAMAVHGGPIPDGN